jgi:hypothetical protein
MLIHLIIKLTCKLLIKSQKKVCYEVRVSVLKLSARLTAIEYSVITRDAMSRLPQLIGGTHLSSVMAVYHGLRYIF